MPSIFTAQRPQSQFKGFPTEPKDRLPVEFRLAVTIMRAMQQTVRSTGLATSSTQDVSSRNAGPDAQGVSKQWRMAARFQLVTGSLHWAYAAILLSSFAAVLSIVHLCRLQEGLYEDGYFVKRFAYNFVHHGSFSWNPTDGPVYGMTSQTLQLLGTLLELADPQHVFLSLKAVLFGAIFLTALLMYRIVTTRRALFGGARRDAVPPSERAAGLLPCVAGLAMAPVIELPLMGLETTIALCVVALSLWAALEAALDWRALTAITLSVVLVYVTRPDATMIPGIVLAGRALYCWRDRHQPGARRELAQLIGALLCIALALALLLGVFRAYYGTALPLPFYIKTHGVSVQPAEYVAIFSGEKTNNALQASLIAAPFVFIAVHERSRLVVLLLAAGGIFGAYHYFATIETMGYLSRFYLPGLVPILLAAGLSYRSYQRRRRWALSAAFCALFLAAFAWASVARELSPAFQFYVPVWIAASVVLLSPAAYNPLSAVAVSACLLIGALFNFPIEAVQIDDDETIVLRQTRRRAVFTGMERLRALEPKTIYHTDMGAPGVLFPRARVVDLDGLLNEDITLRGASFEQLCSADRPDAIYIPNEGYQRLRQEVLSSQCIKNYRAAPGAERGRLRVRADLVERY